MGTCLDVDDVKDASENVGGTWRAQGTPLWSAGLYNFRARELFLFGKQMGPQLV